MIISFCLFRFFFFLWWGILFVLICLFVISMIFFPLFTWPNEITKIQKTNVSITLIDFWDGLFLRTVCFCLSCVYIRLLFFNYQGQTISWINGHTIISNIIITPLRVFHASVSWWFSIGFWMTASLLKSPGLSSVFWKISIMLLFGWSSLVLSFPSLPVPLRILWWLYQARQYQLVLPSFHVHSFFHFNSKAYCFEWSNLNFLKNSLFMIIIITHS